MRTDKSCAKLHGITVVQLNSLVLKHLSRSQYGSKYMIKIFSVLHTIFVGLGITETTARLSSYLTQSGLGEARAFYPRAISVKRVFLFVQFKLQF